MRAIRKRLTYANVISTLALFLVLAGGAAYASRVARKSVGASQLKANSVTTAKIKANAVTTRKIKRNAIATGKIKDGAVESAKIADGSVGIDDLETNSLPYAQVVRRARGYASLAVNESLKSYPLTEGNYVQAATENDTFVGALDVTFSNECKAPRSAEARVLLDAVNPLEPEPEDVVAQGTAVDTAGTGSLPRRIELGGEGGAIQTRFEPGTNKSRKLSLVVSGKCAIGSGISATFGGINVIGTK